MGDSDDEYDRRRPRDKFRRERSDYQDRGGGRRDDWPERDGGSWGQRDRVPPRRDYGREYGNNQRRDRYSGGERSDMSPPIKRMRNTDWEDRGRYSNWDGPSGMGGSYGSHGNNWNSVERDPPHSGNYGSAMGHQQRSDLVNKESDPGPTQPAVMTFKQYLANQDDGIDDQEAIKKYNEYKMDFKKKQIDDFFIAHKDEEWFRSRYHPEECIKRKAEQVTSLKNRLKVFLDLLESKWVDSVSIDVEKSDQITKLLDAAVIKLEGGTDFDLKALDENFDDDKPKEPDLSLFAVDTDVKSENKSEESTWVPPNEEKPETEVSKNGTDDPKVKEEEEEEVPTEEAVKVKEEVQEENDAEEEKKEEAVENEEPVKQEDEEGETQDSDAENEEMSKESIKEEEEVVVKSPTKPVEVKNDGLLVIKPRPLHKTASIFLRNLAPSITKQEVEAMCRKYPGFLRVAIADPQTERRFFRRGWVTFERHVNIREICWSLNSVRLRDCELGAIVNRDLSRRIRSVNGVSSHKHVVRTDIRHTAKIIFNLDQQKCMWDDETSNDGKKGDSQDNVTRFGFKSKNPLLRNITDYLIEEASAEEEELLGTTEIGEIDGDGDDSNGQNAAQTLDRDENLIKVLDRLLLYLRIVHSVDYYNHSDYPNEDEMPNRIGIMHARGSPPSGKVTQKELNEYIKNFESKLSPFLEIPPVVMDDEAAKLGKKDPDDEIEKFIEANTQELAKDKWLCPLSGKKFKGPEFVKKHIQNKHGEKIDEVRKDCEYFNNYLFDGKRPQLPEHPSNRPPSVITPNRAGGDNHAPLLGVVPGNGPMGWGPPPGSPFPPIVGPYGPGYGPPRGPMAGFGGPMGGFGRLPPMGPPIDYARGMMPGARGRGRRRSSYRDLDVPDDD